MKNTHLQLRMNADAERGGIRTRQVTEDAALGGMDLQLVPFEMYDYARAKIAANLSWLFSKAFGTDGVPLDLQDPFYTDQYEQEHIKPPIIHLLLSSELYCIVCGRLLQPQHTATLRNHTSVLQVLSKKGIYVLDENNTLISELDLSSAPIKMDSHIHLIDALMTAYTDEMISVEKVLCTVEYFSETSDSADVPLDLEAAMILWINEIITKLKEFTQTKLKVNHLLESPGHQKVHHRKDRLYERSHQHLSMLDSLSSFVCNGTALLAVVHFYCHDLMKLQDIYLKEVPSIYENLHNIELLRKFSDEFLNKCFHFSPEDMLYSPPVLKSNMMLYIAELFWTFEIVKPDFMQLMDISEIKDARVSLHHQGPSSQKHTFWSSKSTVSSSEISFQTRLNSFSLPRCRKELKEMQGNSSGQRNWSNSIKHSSGQQTSNLAWSRNKQRSLSETAPNAVNFSTKEDGNNICVSRSLHSLSYQRASNFMNNTPNYLPGSGHPRRLSGQSLLNYIRFEDEEEEIEEEELVAIIDPSTLPRRQHQCKPEHKDLNCTRLSSTGSSSHRYYMEPLMPALRKPAKEKSVNVKKEEECGESDSKQAVRRICRGSGAALISNSKYMSNIGLPSLKATTQDSSGVSLQDRSKQFYVHMVERPKDDYPSSLEGSNDYDSDIENFPEDSENELQLEGNMVQSQERNNRKEQRNFAEGESAKLGQDLSMNEWDDKEDHSRCSSPCSSTVSRSSSCNTPTGTGVKMTSFAEKRRLKSSPKTTPDGSETVPWPPLKLKNSYSLDKELCSLSRSNVTVPSEFLELHMELEERRHAIECHKKRMEALSAQQRLKLGKAAFLNIVKKGPGSSGTLPLPLKQEASALRACGKSNVKLESCKDDSCLEALKKITENKLVQESGQDVNVCSQSIEVINEAIISIQQQIMQLSQKQDILIKHTSPFSSKLQIETNATPTANLSQESTATVNFEDESGLFPREPKLSSNPQKASKSKSAFFQILDSKEVKQEDVENCKTDHDKVVNFTSKDFDVIMNVAKTQHASVTSMIRENVSSTAAEEHSKCETQTFDSGTTLLDYPNKSPRMKAQLIEVDFSEMRKPTEDSCTEDKQKNVLGFFFKDEDRPDEMAKRRAAFLIKQQRKAEEAKLRKQQQEAESELKRDEARRKAEEERIRKDEEKARREFIKQEYLRKKQQMLVEAQGLVESLPRTRSRKSRPKSLHREGPSSLFKGTTTPDLSESRRGSTLSLATETESVISVEYQRAGSVCSMDLPVLSRASSRNMDRDWDNGSIASSITSTEYTGPKLYKEPSAKSNKPIIINAIAHCCLAGKVNEIQKNAILEELDKCESNHLIILFRDGGCQFRAIYSYSPDTEEITKVSGTGPRNITQKMIDKLYKYSSDRKQFSVIPAKCVSVSIDALTIHNHLWHVRRPGSARRK